MKKRGEDIYEYVSWDLYCFVYDTLIGHKRVDESGITTYVFYEHVNQQAIKKCKDLCS